MTNSPAHVMILGCGRSGTSIFGELFEHLSAYVHLSEPPYDQVRQLDFRQPHAIKVPTESAVFPPSPGLSFPLDDLLSIIPARIQFFWQIRHPLDTICSLRVGISKNWGHHPKPPDWQVWLQRPLLERCAHHWNYLNTIGYEQVADRVVLSSFEEMLTDPLAFSMNICSIIGLDSEKHQSELQAWASRVQNSNNAQFVEAKTSRPYSTTDHLVRISRWKENLTSEEVRSISPLIEETAANFGYFWQG